MNHFACICHRLKSLSQRYFAVSLYRPHIVTSSALQPRIPSRPLQGLSRWSGCALAWACAIVLVSVDSLADLKAAYPSYYGDRGVSLGGDIAAYP
jgi:hypothetical protein